MFSVNSKRIKVILISLLLLVPMFVMAAEPTKPTTFAPEIAIPGMGDLPNDGSLMSRYLRAVYVFFIWIVGLLAVVMVIYGGIRWISAAGNAGRIKEARDTVTNAIIGIILALGSIALLNTINPDLTRLSTFSLSKVAGITLAKYNAQLECYEVVKCPDQGYKQTYGGACGGGVISGAFTYVNPGDPVCDANQAKGICCQATDGSNKCMGINSKDGSKQFSGDCRNVTINVTALCTDQTPCGSIKNDKSCRGGYCGNGEVCYINDDASGTCITGNGRQSVRITNCDESYSYNFSNQLPCGTISQNGSSYTIGSNPSSCTTGQHCLLQPPNAVLNDSANGVRCQYVQTGTNPPILSPQPTFCG